MRRPRISLAVVTAALLALVACSDSAAPSSWAIVDPPTVANETDDIVSANATVADGTYWAEIAPVSGSGDIAFRIVKARFGATCEAWARENGLEFCANDYAVETYPVAYVALDDDAEVTVAKPDGPGTSYSISVDTLHRVLRGDTGGAPDGYAWAAFPFLVDVVDGYAVAARQYWVP